MQGCSCEGRSGTVPVTWPSWPAGSGCWRDGQMLPKRVAGQGQGTLADGATVPVLGSEAWWHCPCRHLRTLQQRHPLAFQTGADLTRGRLGDGLRDCGEVPGVGQAWGTQMPCISLTAHMPALSRHCDQAGLQGLGIPGGQQDSGLGFWAPDFPQGQLGIPELWCRDRAQS